MFAGPIFAREALTAPRRTSHYLVRAGYVAALFVLMYTAGQSTFGWQQLRNVGDFARFGQLVFQLFSVVQLSLVLFFALVFAAANVAQEKDRRTLLLLFTTDLGNRELVLGKLLASVLIVGVLVGVSAPVFAFVHMLGGVGSDQVLWMLALCAATAFVAASWGTLVAFWREKTFQTLAVSVLGVLLLIGFAEAAAEVIGRETTAGRWIAAVDPFRTLSQLLSPLADNTSTDPVRVSALPSVLVLTGLGLLLNSISIARLRVWYPPRTIHQRSEAAESAETQTAVAEPRTVWRAPILWREIMTRAYGRKVVAIKLAYVVLAAATVYFVVQRGGSALFLGMLPVQGLAFVGLGLLSLMLVNAQAVTAITSERDGNTLELLLVTDVTSREFVLGKLLGILYNAKEVLAIPVALAVYFAIARLADPGDVALLVLGFLVLAAFAAMLGVHAGLSHDQSRAAIGNSLGTMFFLFVGIFVFMMLLVEARGSYLLQIQSFLLFIGCGSIALYASLTAKNPSNALMLAAGGLPFLTFYAIVSFLLGNTAEAFVAIALAYGFTTVAMLVPAISDFDVALGRSSDRG